MSTLTDQQIIDSVNYEVQYSFLSHGINNLVITVKIVNYDEIMVRVRDPDYNLGYIFNLSISLSNFAEVVNEQVLDILEARGKDIRQKQESELVRNDNTRQAKELRSLWPSGD